MVCSLYSVRPAGDGRGASAITERVAVPARSRYSITGSANRERAALNLRTESREIMPTYRYPTSIPGVEIESDIRLPTGDHYPPHLAMYRLFGVNRPAPAPGSHAVGWQVECRVCGKWTGRTRNRMTLAKFLRQHRACGLLRTPSKPNGEE